MSSLADLSVMHSANVANGETKSASTPPDELDLMDESGEFMPLLCASAPWTTGVLAPGQVESFVVRVPIGSRVHKIKIRTKPKKCTVGSSDTWVRIDAIDPQGNASEISSCNIGKHTTATRFKISVRHNSQYPTAEHKSITVYGLQILGRRPTTDYATPSEDECVMLVRRAVDLYQSRYTARYQCDESTVCEVFDPSNHTGVSQPVGVNVHFLTSLMATISNANICTYQVAEILTIATSSSKLSVVQTFMQCMTK